MTDRELRFLSRQELIVLLCKLKKEETAMRAQIEELQSQLADRKLKFDKAGTLAEAMISVNGVLDAAQKAADQYLEEVKNASSNIEKTCSDMIAKTRSECTRREEETDRQINAKWSEFEHKVESYIQTHAELEALLDSKQTTR